MSLPWVSRESAERLVAYHAQVAREWKDLFYAEAAKTAALLEKYHELRVSGANAPAPAPPVPVAEMPPPEVLRAMRIISPRDDQTFKANWDLWLANKDEAAKDPAKFAERIRRGRLSPEPIEEARST